MLPPLTDGIAAAVSKLVDDAQTDRRDPSHWDLETQIQRAGLSGFDPKGQGQTVGKAKRVTLTFYAALSDELEKGQRLVALVIDVVRARGGFRPDSPNFVGAGPLDRAIAEFDKEGWVLTQDGNLRPKILDGLSGVKLTDALERYVQRARRGALDSALVIGTGKDLLEATAAHVVSECFGGYSSRADFPTLLGQAFTSLKLSTPADPRQPNESPTRRLDRALYELGCAVNKLRNKEGTGHGRPWLPTVRDDEAQAAIEAMGLVAGRLLDALKNRPQ